MMDRTDLADWLSIQMLVVAYGKRVLPLAWQVLDGGHQSRHKLNLIKNDPVSAGPERRRVFLCLPQHVEAIQRVIAPVFDWLAYCRSVLLPTCRAPVNTTARCSVIAV